MQLGSTTFHPIKSKCTLLVVQEHDSACHVAMLVACDERPVHKLTCATQATIQRQHDATSKTGEAQACVPALGACAGAARIRTRIETCTRARQRNAAFPAAHMTSCVV